MYVQIIVLSVCQLQFLVQGPYSKNSSLWNLSNAKDSTIKSASIGTKIMKIKHFKNFQYISYEEAFNYMALKLTSYVNNWWLKSDKCYSQCIIIHNIFLVWALFSVNVSNWSFWDASNCEITVFQLLLNCLPVGLAILQLHIWISWLLIQSSPINLL